MGSGLGGVRCRYRNQQPFTLSVAVVSLLRCILRFSKTTAFLGLISGISTFCTQAANAGPSMAPLVTQGADQSVNSPSCDQSWCEVLLKIKIWGMNATAVAITEGAIGFWAALDKVCILGPANSVACNIKR